MANKNFNKQVVPARTKLAIGGPATKKEITNDLSSGTKEMRERKNERLKRFNDKRSPSDMMIRPKPPKPVPLTPKQIKKLRDRMDKKRGDMMEKKRGKVVVNKTQKGGRKRTKSMMDSTRAKSLGLK